MNNIKDHFYVIFINPLRPAQSTTVTGTSLAITHQPLKLESCSNPLWIQQVFLLKSKNTFLGGGFAGETATSEDVLEILASPGPQPIAPFFWLKVSLKTRSKSASVEPLIDLLAYL